MFHPAWFCSLSGNIGDRPFRGRCDNVNSSFRLARTKVTLLKESSNEYLSTSFFLGCTRRPLSGPTLHVVSYDVFGQTSILCTPCSTLKIPRKPGQTRTCDLCVRFSHGDFALLRYAPAAPHSAHTLLVLCSDFTHDMLVICSHGAHLLLAAQSLSGSVLR